jgi:outer membrane murein-binding lipoprotein Lpp
MQADFLTKRVEILENTVNGPGGLSEKVDRLESKVDQLQVDVAGLRVDMNGLRTDVDALRTDFLHFKDETRIEFAAVHQGMATGFALARQDNEETRIQMRVLHEEVISRIALLQERRNEG